MPLQTLPPGGSQQRRHGTRYPIQFIAKKTLVIINQINDIQTSIASAVEEQTATTNEISRSVAEAAQGTNEIASNIADVARAAREATVGAGKALKSAESLALTAADLQKLVTQEG